jgi:Flp pilus assembly protein TadG
MNWKRRVTQLDSTNCDERRKGTLTVELAIILPVILFLLFSILEMGFMVKNRAELGQAAREAARLAAVGATPTRMDAGVQSALATIPADDVQATYEYRPWDEDASSWGSWTTLGTDGDHNNAETGDQVRVRLNYQHPLLVPGLMGPVLSADENGERQLSASSVMMRE